MSRGSELSLFHAPGPLTHITNLFSPKSHPSWETFSRLSPLPPLRQATVGVVAKIAMTSGLVLTSASMFQLLRSVALLFAGGGRQFRPASHH